MCATAVVGCLAWKNVSGGWGIKNNPHSYFAFPVLFLVLFIGVFGIVTRSALQYSEWKTRVALRLKLTHKIIAYFVILTAAVAIFFGIQHYRRSPKHPFDLPLEWIHAAFFIAILALLETIHRLCQRRNAEFESVKLRHEAKRAARATEISIRDFRARIK